MGKEMSKADAKEATLKMTLKYKSGYGCKPESTTTPNQWRGIQLVIEGKLKSE